MIFDHSGKVVAVSQKEHEQIYPKPGWVEHDAKEIWARCQEVIDEAVDKAGASADDIAALGITNQRETTLVWDRNTGEPVHNALVWQDTRTDKLVDELSADGGQDRFREKVGLPLATYFSGPKVSLDPRQRRRRPREGGGRRPGVRQHGHLADLEPHRRHRRRQAHHRRHQRQPDDADGPGVPVLGLGHRVDDRRPDVDAPRDPRLHRRSTARSARAASCRASRSPATSATSRRPRSARPALTSARPRTPTARATSCCSTPARRPCSPRPACSRPSVTRSATASRCTRWRGRSPSPGRSCSGCATTSSMIKAAPEVEELAKSVDDNGGLYIVPAFSGLFAPYWKSNARGVFAGLTRYVNAGHIARATLEATAFQTREVVDAMATDSGVTLESLKVDGGMVANDLLMQFQADILGVPVIRPAGGRDHRARRLLRRRHGRRLLGLRAGGPRQLGRGQALGTPRWSRRSATSTTSTGRRPSPAPSTGSTDAEDAFRGWMSRAVSGPPSASFHPRRGGGSLTRW